MKGKLTALILCLLLLYSPAACAARTPSRADDFGRGGIRVLVLPIAFADSGFGEGELALLETVLDGEPEETGWHSVRSYYEVSSYGQLSVRFDLAPVYTCPHDAAYYEAQFEQEDGEDWYTEETILQEALRALRETDFAEYDANGGGCLDAVMMVYAHEMDYDAEDTLWWSWQSVSYVDGLKGYEADYYAWISIEEMYLEVGRLTPAVGATSFIHEFGHLIGLMDYYDTTEDDDLCGGLGGFDMMDDCYGDHCAFSKYILGWIEPTEVTGEQTYYLLTPLGERGDALLLRKPGTRTGRMSGFLFDHAYGGVYGEYLLIDLFTAEGLNEPFAGVDGLPRQPGVRVYHVDAAAARGSRDDFYYEPFARNNSEGPHKLISLVEADGDDSIAAPDGFGYVAESDYFHAGEEVHGLTWYDGTPVGYSIRVDAVNGQYAVVAIEPEAPQAEPAHQEEITKEPENRIDKE